MSSEEQDAAACSARSRFDLSETFPCTRGVNSNLLCFARELPRAVSNLSCAEGDEAACAVPIACGPIVIWISNLANSSLRKALSLLMFSMFDWMMQIPTADRASDLLAVSTEHLCPPDQ